MHGKGKNTTMKTSTISIKLPEGCTASRGILTIPGEAAAKSLRGKLSNHLIVHRSGGGGRQPTCTCGTCRKCYMREAKRRSRSRMEGESITS